MPVSSDSDARSDDWLPRIERRHVHLIAVLAAVFVLAIALRLNGWSLPIWHALIDGSKPSEVVWGQPRNVRSDDFLLDLGMTLAQEKARPQFPIVNPDFGAGEYLGAPISVPAGVFITLFRPFTWGFLLGPDVGLAWKWWGLTLGLFASFFAVLLLVSRSRFWLSVMGSVAVVVSPYFQFWSLHKAEVAIHWCGAFIGIAVLLAARRRGTIWAAGVFSGWSLAAMFLDHIYPPIAISLGWLLPFAIAAWIIDRNVLPRLRQNGAHRLGAMAAALVILAGSLGLFWIQGHDAIELIRHTVYPGRRFSSGGSMPVWAFFSQLFFPQHWEHGHPWFGNICEGASFLYLFPAAWVLLLQLGIRGRRSFEPWNVLLGIYLAGIFFYTYVGLPDWLARFTLLGLATSNRTQLGMGLASQLMFVAFCARTDLRRGMTGSVRWMTVGFWLAAVAAAGFWFRSGWPQLPLSAIALGVLFQAALAYLFWIRDQPTAAMALLAAGSAAYTMGFNPWVRGGSDFVLHNPLANEIRTLDRADAHQHRWAVFDQIELGHYPQMIGARGIGGYNTCPDLSTWQAFDPGGRARRVYNQTGYAIFTTGRDPGQVVFVPMQPGFFIVEADPLHPAFARLGVRYYLVASAAGAETFRKCRGFREVFAYAGKVIFERI